MKILGICGSPRKGGNSDTLLEKALEKASALGAETRKIRINDLNISPCQEIEYDEVNEKGFSVIDDDMDMIFREIKECDSIILASPVFFGSISAQMKMMIDRFQCVWVARNVLNKEVYPKRINGGFLCVGATDRRGFFNNASSIVKNFFAIINAEYKEELFCTGLDEKGSVLTHPEFLDEAGRIGERLGSSEARG